MSRARLQHFAVRSLFTIKSTVIATLTCVTLVLLTLVVAPAANAGPLPFPGSGIGQWGVSGFGTAVVTTGTAGSVTTPPPGGVAWMHFSSQQDVPGHWLATVNTTANQVSTGAHQYRVSWDQYETTGANLKLAIGNAGALTGLPANTWNHNSGLLVVSSLDLISPTFHFSADTNSGPGPEAGLANVSIDPAEPTISGPGAVSVTAGQSTTVNYPVTNAGSCSTSGLSWASVALSGNTCVLTLSPDNTLMGNSSVSVGVRYVDTSLAQSTSTTVTVIPAVDHIIVLPATATKAAGSTQAFTARAYNPANIDLGDVTSATTFTITGAGSCGGAACGSTVAGSYTVTGSYLGHTDTAALTVTAAGLDHLVVTPATATITAGSTQDYNARAYDQFNNQIGDVTADSAFTISDGGTCTDNSCGSTIAQTYTVTATYNGTSSNVDLTVTPAAASYVVVTPDSSTVVAGDDQNYTADVFDEYGNLIGDVTADTTFTSDDNGTCTDSSCGSTVAGPYTVTATYNGLTADVQVTVTPAAADHLLISPATSTVDATNTQAYTADAYDVYDNLIGDVTADTTFTISDGGTCTGNTCGSTTPASYTVTGTYEVPDSTGDGDQPAMTLALAAVPPSLTATSVLTVTAGPLFRLALSPASATVNVNETQAYTAEGFDTYGNSLGDVTADTTFTLSGSGSCVAAVCSSSDAGHYKVTAVDGTVQATATLTVNAPAAAAAALASTGVPLAGLSTTAILLLLAGVALIAGGRRRIRIRRR